MTKKVAIIGKGTAGAISALEAFHRSKLNQLHSLDKIEIDWYFDPSISPQEVGEGTSLLLPQWLSERMLFKHTDARAIDSTHKIGISKSNWGVQDFIHEFLPPNVAMHVNAVKLQSFIFDFLRKQNNVNVISNNVNNNEIDADLILDCSGRPKNYDDFIVSPYIPVNSVYVTQCFWDTPKFDYSITDAASHGWVFGIPLQNRCSIGYLYNNQLTTLEEVKEDVKKIFEKYKLTPSEKTNSFSFNNYYRKRNFSDNIVYNGNASFFLEPLEATTLGNVATFALQSFRYIQQKSENRENLFNKNYKFIMESTTAMIMCHYYAGSKFDTPFWKFAEERATKCIEQYYNEHPLFASIVKTCVLVEPHLNMDTDLMSIHPSVLLSLKQYQKMNNSNDHVEYGSWGWYSWIYNVSKLGIRNKLKEQFKL